MKKNRKFIEFENLDEFEKYFNKLKITRFINKLQVHHMDLPNYSTWKNTDCKKWGSNAPLNRTESLDSYGKNTWHSGDGHGHYIAQHYNVFPNGHITTGRDINSTPIGIKGWNTGAICVEIYGDFDKGVDNMTKEQKEAVIGLYAIMAKRLKLPVNSTYIRPHCWFTAYGTYLGTYDTGRSAKSCPGSNFMGFGTKKTNFAEFYRLIKNSPYYTGKKDGTGADPKPPSGKIKLVKNISNESLNIRETADWDGKVINQLKPGDSLTYLDTVTPKNGTTKMYKTKSGYVTASDKYTKMIEISK